MEDARTVLADMLSRIDSADTDPLLRLSAATMANRLALFHGDPSLTDVAESLIIDAGENTPPSIQRDLEAEQAVARATRRAIALGHNHRLKQPRDRALGLVQDPAALAQRVRDQRQDGKNDEAAATLEVARIRHPDDSGLQRLDDSAPPTG